MKSGAPLVALPGLGVVVKRDAKPAAEPMGRCLADVMRRVEPSEKLVSLTAEDIDDIAERLARLDAKGAWTKKTLALIDRHPRVAASQLAKKLGRETLPFKLDVRKLKRLGLTQGFEVGYEISPRGRVYLEGCEAVAEPSERSTRARGTATRKGRPLRRPATRKSKKTP